MAYPFLPEGWTEPVNQNLYAAVVFLIIQAIYLGLWKLLKLGWKNKSSSKFLIFLGWIGLAAPPFAIVGLAIVNGIVSKWLPFVLLLSLFPAMTVLINLYRFQKQRAIQAESVLGRLQAIGITDAIPNPDIDAYREFIDDSNHAFAFLGVGAEKLTRDFNVFQAMVSRCGKPADPVRLLLVSPDADWLKSGAVRRGLGKSTFLDKQAASLLRIARVKSEFSGEIIVRFYSTRPVLRLLFANRRSCWFGHYSESAAIPGQNEFAEQSNSSVVLEQPNDRAPDQQFYGALESLFEEMWVSAKEAEWDFKMYLQ